MSMSFVSSYSYTKVAPDMKKKEREIKTNMKDVSINLEQTEMCALRGFHDTHPEHFITSVTLLEDEITGE